jgi:hypothetical protein
MRQATPDEQARVRSGIGDDGKGGGYTFVVDEEGYGVYFGSDGSIIYFSDIGIKD